LRCKGTTVFWYLQIFVSKFCIFFEKSFKSLSKCKKMLQKFENCAKNALQIAFGR